MQTRLLWCRCWAGIGLSANGTMGDATVFIIGQFNNGTASVGLYQVADAPYGHAPPVVRAPFKLKLCLPARCMCSGVARGMRHK